MNKDLLKIKKLCRRGLSSDINQLSKVILHIFSIKYSLSEYDLSRKLSTCVNLSNLNDSQCINECPLSDKLLLPLYSEGSGIARLIYKLLLEISDETPSVTYAPLLFPLVSFLTTYLPEVEIKNIAVTLLGETDMIPSSTNDWNVFCHLLPVLGRRFATKAYRNIRSLSDVEQRKINFWPYALLSLPLIFLTRVLICYFVEGSKVLIRAGLLIWKETFIRRGTDNSSFDLREELMSTASTIGQTYTPQSFLDRMFRIRNLSKSTVFRCKRGLKATIRMGEWISPTTCKSYIAFKSKDANPSSIITPMELIDLIRNLNPYLQQINKPIPLFNTSKHGYSLRTLYNVASDSASTLLIIETALGEIFGAFCADPWSLKNRSDVTRFFGKGECFVFRVRPRPLTIYRWNQDRENILSNMFQRATHESLEVGGGSTGCAISINADLSRGKSSKSSTFDSPCLTDFSKEEFLIKSLELLGFEEIH